MLSSINRKDRPIRCAAALLLSVFALPVQAQQAPAIPEEVAASIRARVDAGDNPAIIVGVIDAGGTTLYAYGRVGPEQDAAPDAHTVFEIGSITKAFTGLLLAEMAARGEVALDDPVARYLPEGVSMPGGEAITLAHLASHTSGLPRLPTNFAPADMGNPYADYTAEQLYAFLNAYTLPRAPGEQYAYSNLGMGLLGHVLARRAGTDYETLLRERILGPLGLGDTGIALTEDQRARLATGYRDGRPVAYWDLPALAGAGALRSTADELLRFLAAHLGLAGTPLDAVMDEATTPRAEAAGPNHVGLGWHVRRTDRSEMVWHNGGTGGFSSFAGYDPARGRGVVVLANSSADVDDLGAHILDPTVPLAEVRVPVDVAPEVLERYVGTYQIAPTFSIVIIREEDRLFAQATGQPQFSIYPSSDSTFFLKAVEAELHFQVDAEGVVQGVVLHQNGRQMPGRRME
ncbi:MAG: serine hydrolase [Rhodothermales bacterium]|nr:serine hydrolase [Rhodothermales bacterium]